MMPQATQQLNAEIDAKLVQELEELKNKTRVSKRALVEQALRLLLEQYRAMTAVYKKGVVDQQFMMMADQVMKRYDPRMKKLAQ